MLKDFEVVAYATPDAELFCPDCAGDEARARHEKLAGWTPVFAGDEWDYIPCCDGCGAPISDISLTTAGWAAQYDADHRAFPDDDADDAE